MPFLAGIEGQPQWCSEDHEMPGIKLGPLVCKAYIQYAEHTLQPCVQYLKFWEEYKFKKGTVKLQYNSILKILR